MSTPNCLAKYQNQITSEIHKILDGSTRPQIKMVYYHLGWLDKEFNQTKADPGKFSRPSLVLLTAEALGGDMEEALKLAASIQTFHDFTLMHDDIEDGDSLRRHRETVWKVWGVPRAINAGDAMYTLSIQSILRLKNKKDELMAYLLSVYGEIVYGQELDLSFVERKISEISTEDYLAMIGGKSAWLIGASTKAGAMISGAKEEVCEEFYNFGYNLGLAYQVFDDYVSIWGDCKDSGKVEHMDIIEKKKTLPILLLINAASEDDRNILNEIYNENKISHESVVTVLDLLSKYNIKSLMKEQIISYRDKSRIAIDNLDLDKNKAANYSEIVNWLIPGEVI